MLETITEPVRKLFMPINSLLPSYVPFLRSMDEEIHFYENLLSGFRKKHSDLLKKTRYLSIVNIFLTWHDTHFRATIGADFLAKVVQWDTRLTLKLQLWDIAGQDRFSLLSRSFYKDAAGAFIVSDITRPETLDAVIRWKEELDAKVGGVDGEPIPCFLLANKCDLLDDTHVQSKQHSKVCQKYGFGGWMQTSAKEDINVNAAIEMLLRQVCRRT